MAIVEIFSTPNFRSLVKRSKDRINWFIRDCGGEALDPKTHTAAEMARHAMKMWNELQAKFWRESQNLENMCPES